MDMKTMRKKVTNMMRVGAAFLISVSLIALIGSAPAKGQGTENSSSVAVTPLRIGSGDLIQVTMYQNPDLSGQFRVDEQGDITIPLIGHVKVTGETAEEAATVIEKRFVDGQILQPAEAHATVFVLEYATQGITVTGEVKQPGVYPALGVRLINDVVTAAGGENPAAASQVVITHRNDPDHPITVEYNPSALNPIVPKVQLVPGDSIIIPRAGIVYVLGAVARSGGYVLDGRRALTVEQVMALAGGSGHAAALSRVQLVRTLEDGRKEAITIPVNLILKGKAPDVALRDGDVVYIPTSTGKLVAEQAIQSAVSVGSSVAIYRTSIQ